MSQSQLSLDSMGQNHMYKSQHFSVCMVISCNTKQLLSTSIHVLLTLTVQ